MPDLNKNRIDAFPRLAPQMMNRLLVYGSMESMPSGSELFRRGDHGVDFFVILEGEIELRDTENESDDWHTLIAERQFTGELNLFNDCRNLVTGRAGIDSRVLRIRRSDFRRVAAEQPEIAEIIMRAFILRRAGLIEGGRAGALLIGSKHDGNTLRIHEFLTRNGLPHRVLDGAVDPEAEGFFEFFGLTQRDLPVIVTLDQTILRNPTNVELADSLGLTEHLDATGAYDLAVIGAGPAGLATAVYAASEGLRVIVIEGSAPGGQAGSSSRIENYLGFPLGISGQDLASSAQIQAQKFGASMSVSRRVERIDCDADPYCLYLESRGTVFARSIVIATGARYRTLAVHNHAKYEGHAVHYAATAIEAALCQGQEVVVVGAGNSAGQAAVFLSQSAAHVHLVFRGEDLAITMSNYLVQRIRLSPTITLHASSEITSLSGSTTLQEISWTNRQTGSVETRSASHVFVMIGAEPNTEWLRGCVELDSKGFIKTGQKTSPYETTQSGVFAVGDVRSGSVKRVASAVGEGAVVVASVHAYLNAKTA